jgi:hypothetical protein
MRVGIVGSGAAGLCTAWLLERDHEVTVFEKDVRFGGHAETVPVTLGGKTYAVDTGIHFFAPLLQPRFMRLLDHLKAPYRAYRPTAVFHHEGTGRTVCLPPFGNAGRLRTLGQPGAIGTLLNFRKLIQCGIPLVEDGGDPFVTLEDFLAGSPVPRAFQEDFVFPYLSSYWGVDPETVRGYAARNALAYLVILRPPVVTPRPMCEMVGGMQAYIDLLVGDLQRTTLLDDTGVSHVRRVDDTYEITTSRGTTHVVDHLVIATNAEQARGLLENLPGSEDARRALEGVRYFGTTIAVHGDTRLMPPNRAHWSTANALFDGTYCATTDWGDSNRDVDLFRSWVTHRAALPDPCYAEVRYRHPHPTPDYFRAQQALRPLQGQDNLWFTGMYVDYFDNHDGAVRSAMRVGEALAPESARLDALRA